MESSSTIDSTFYILLEICNCLFTMVFSQPSLTILESFVQHLLYMNIFVSSYDLYCYTYTDNVCQ